MGTQSATTVAIELRAIVVGQKSTSCSAKAVDSMVTTVSPADSTRFWKKYGELRKVDDSLSNGNVRLLKHCLTNCPKPLLPTDASLPSAQLGLNLLLNLENSLKHACSQVLQNMKVTCFVLVPNSHSVQERYDPCHQPVLENLLLTRSQCKTR